MTAPTLAAMAVAAMIPTGEPQIEVPGPQEPLDLKGRGMTWECPPQQAPRFCRPPPRRPEFATYELPSPYIILMETAYATGHQGIAVGAGNNRGHDGSGGAAFSSAGSSAAGNTTENSATASSSAISSAVAIAKINDKADDRVDLPPVAPVPLPSGLPFLAAALGLALFLRRRF